MNQTAQELYNKSIAAYQNNAISHNWYVDRLNDILAENSAFDADHKEAAKMMLRAIADGNIFFNEGLHIIKSGRKTIAKVIDRVVRYGHAENCKYPYCVEVPKMGGAFDCMDLTEVHSILTKYTTNQ